MNNKVVVLLGASSGIGRATAITLAGRGATLILAARRKNVIEEVAEECNQKGGKAHAIPTDITDATQVRKLAEEAISLEGRIDVWINNVGIGAVGEFTQTPLDVHERVIQTNLLGAMTGAYTVLPYFKKQQYGILINTISLGAWIAQPYTVAYHASKFGIRGLSEALRAELIDEENIRVCDVFPAYIDTPGFQHGANYIGKKIKPIPPVYDAQLVANAITALVDNPKDSVTVGASASVLRFTNLVFPKSVRRTIKTVIDNYFERADPAPIGNNALFEASPVGQGISGGWRSGTNKNKWRPAALVALASALAGGYFLVRRDLLG